MNPKTIFCDLDGTLVKHPSGEGILKVTDPEHELELLPGTEEFLKWVDLNRHYLVITTGRKESCREATIKQLQRANIWYDQLIMGFGSGDRVLINDRKTDGRQTAFAINLERNGGIKNVEI
jgi:phosphoglycolate phosphatase-like HAD superfamily hydrolase|tara:strand:+ start:137 stop:499 length:363 start_codon:yes stop_codon:yes gene_type:complete